MLGCAKPKREPRLPHCPPPLHSHAHAHTHTHTHTHFSSCPAGTNDAKDKGDGGPSNWSGCDGVEGCAFAQDYLSMIELVRTLGTTPGVPPTIYIAAPPPLMQHGSIGANQTAINTVYPSLIPLIAEAANLTTVPISIYAAMGGVPTWATSFPSGCTLKSPWAACPWYCDQQSCDQVRECAGVGGGGGEGLGAPRTLTHTHDNAHVVLLTPRSATRTILGTPAWLAR